MTTSSFVVYDFDTPLFEDIVKERINRFVVVTKSGKFCHLHDPGRLKELIYAGNRILIREHKGKKTNYMVVAAYSGTGWVVTDSSIHNKIARNFLPLNVKSEVKVNNSRLDFYYDNTFVEVKGCSLVVNGKALFPDAPTERGKRHLEELIRLKMQGYRSLILILVMRDDATCFSPNWKTDEKFAMAFKRAVEEGVEVTIKLLKLIDNKIWYIKDIELCPDAFNYSH
ncbi:XRE family transcriptional regulator [Sulfolobus acidocaldarius SUSAZ]|nr:XRE family transcriptional regulator [Sulfolobus acidocaldarius SUSAZ]